jgi:glutaredoxin
VTVTIRTVRLYSRQGCHLCEQAEELLEELAAECPLDLDIVDITNDPDLFDRFRYEIPVVAVEGGGTVSGRISMEDLRRVLRLGPPRGGARPHEPSGFPSGRLR